MAKDRIDVIFGPRGIAHDETGVAEGEGVVVHEQLVVHELCTTQDRGGRNCIRVSMPLLP